MTLSDTTADLLDNSFQTYINTVKTHSKKTDILQSASKLFNRYGYKSVGIDRIIKESNIAKMTLYHHFKSKDEIILEVLTGYNLTLSEQILGPLENKVMTPEKKIRALVEVYRQWFESPEFYGCPFHKAIAEFPEKENPVQLKIIEHHNLLHTFIYQTVKSKKLANQILLVIEGSVIQAKISGNSEAANEAWAIISKLMAN
jgi:AcrR family transcriptional regulator